jgi:pSer/pThr/pTyr-binding forkhead associated (FHA) protein
MSAQMLVIVGPDRGRSFLLSPGATLQVGRSQSTDTQLSDGTVSRTHCEIIFDGTQAVLVNLSSKGTLVNGLAVSRQELHHGDVIRLGTTEIRFSLSATGEAETLLQPSTVPPPGSAE